MYLRFVQDMFKYLDETTRKYFILKKDPLSSNFIQHVASRQDKGSIAIDCGLEKLHAVKKNTNKTSHTEGKQRVNGNIIIEKTFTGQSESHTHGPYGKVIQTDNLNDSRQELSNYADVDLSKHSCYSIAASNRYNTRSHSRKILTESTQHNEERKLVLAGSEIQRPFDCDECEKSFRSNIQLKKHMLNHSDKKYFCKVRGRSFKSNKKRIFHKLIHGGERPHICEICSMCFMKKKHLNMHMSIHAAKPHICEVCSRCFRMNEQLVAHKLIHSTERPHICDVCKKGFKKKKHLIVHMMTHSDKKPHVCGVCKKCFRMNGQLSAHMKIHNGKKEHVCKVCKKSFWMNGQLKAHMKIHNHERKHVCKVCKKGFKMKGHLNTHMKIHNDERAYVCKRFAKKVS